MHQTTSRSNPAWKDFSESEDFILELVKKTPGLKQVQIVKSMTEQHAVNENATRILLANLGKRKVINANPTSGYHLLAN